LLAIEIHNRVSVIYIPRLSAEKVYFSSDAAAAFCCCLLLLLLLLLLLPLLIAAAAAAAAFAASAGAAHATYNFIQKISCVTCCASFSLVP
jgi:hypothetical protein